MRTKKDSHELSNQEPSVLSPTDATGFLSGKKSMRDDQRTVVCKNFQFKGFCNFGIRCKFLHDRESDIEEFIYAMEQSRQLCKLYKYNGFCPYGAECRFLHQEMIFYKKLNYLVYDVGKFGGEEGDFCSALGQKMQKSQLPVFDGICRGKLARRFSYF